MSQNSDKPLIIPDDDSEVILGQSPSGGARPDQSARAEGSTVPETVAVLPVRNMVIFPGTVAPLAIGRDRSRRLLEEILPAQKIIVTVCQRDAKTDDPGKDDLFQVGTAVMVLKLLRMDDGNQNIIVQGISRIKVREWLAFDPYLKARISILQEAGAATTETEALVAGARQLAKRVIELTPNIPDEAAVVLNNIEQPGALADFLAANLPMEISARQTLLEELDFNSRLRKVTGELQHHVEVLELSDKIQNQIKSNIDKSQREYYLQEQLKAIQKELGQADDKTVEIEQLRGKLNTAGMPETVMAEATRELGRMEKIPAASPEYAVIRTYLDIMCELPWNKATIDQIDVNRAKKILNADHYDLEKVKRRILEYLAVRKLAPESRGPILCFVGPPGVGKTSLGQSIARALGRNFIRMSLGGMHDEAELRGHRRTYIGAMPGRLIQEMRKGGSNNPVFMLDELDKVGADFRGDPTSALLEVLDPAQNSTFQDHYLNVPFDLSKVMFIATANYMGPVPPALKDRMEVIEIPGYTQKEKLQIAVNYLTKRQLKENGLKEEKTAWTESAINTIIADYTREAGVRELERQIGTVCRGIAARVAAGKGAVKTIDPKVVATYLGPIRYENEVALRTAMPGVATGLAYTPAGGDIIFIEAAQFPGKGELKLTGQIGDIMKESAQAAFSLVKSRHKQLTIDPRDIMSSDVHVHVPAGAVPKDGPSAGTAMFTALASLLTNTPVRNDVAMTGEITLRGLVLPIGGVKEKVLAAKQAGITNVILPFRNKRDLADVPPEARKGLKFHFAKTVDDVLRTAFKK